MERKEYMHEYKQKNREKLRVYRNEWKKEKRRRERVIKASKVVIEEDDIEYYRPSPVIHGNDRYKELTAQDNKWLEGTTKCDVCEQFHRPHKFL